MMWLAVRLLWLLPATVVTGIPILSGRFETTSDVQAILDLASDAAQMKEATSFQVKENIYKNVSTLSSCRGWYGRETKDRSHQRVMLLLLLFIWLFVAM